MAWYFYVNKFTKPTGATTLMAEGDIVSPDGRRWPADSGGYGKGPLPPGKYAISHCRIRNDEAMRKSMSDISGDFWSCNIDAQFESGRNLLRIHPDGNAIGTAGCIGLRDNNTSEVLESIIESGDFDLRVVYLGVILV